MTADTPTMLIAYDGTARARRALAHAIRLLRPGTVELLTAWEPVARQAARALGRTGLPQTPIELERDGDTDPAQAYALQVLQEGVDYAESLGAHARAHLVETSGTTPQAIVEAAKELDVDVIVAGTRGLSGIRSWFNTSTAEQILQNAGRPVFIVPPAEDEDSDEDDTASNNPLSTF